MNYSSFIRKLQEQWNHHKIEAHPYILRFINRKEFLCFMKQLKGSLSTLAPNIQPLRSIHAIRCILTEPFHLPYLKGIHSLEKDLMMRIHASPVLRNPKDRRSQAPWSVRHINAPKAWKFSTGKSVKIGVIDTGIDYSHPSLRHSLGKGVNLVQPNLLPSDDNGHGTHIAGTIAAWSAKGGMLGVAPNATIYPIKAFDHKGAAHASNIIHAIEWCLRNGIGIINMSFGMKQGNKALHEAIRRAYAQGVIFIASAGNDGSYKTVDYPACYEQVIAVGATNQHRAIAQTSNRGPKVQIYAPGRKIYSCWPNNRYTTLTGTSMATAHVTGAIALIHALRPRLSSQQTLTLLQKSAHPIRHKAKSKPKEIDAYRLVQLAIKSKQL